MSRHTLDTGVNNEFDVPITYCIEQQCTHGNGHIDLTSMGLKRTTGRETEQHRCRQGAWYIVPPARTYIVPGRQRSAKNAPRRLVPLSSRRAWRTAKYRRGGSCEVVCVSRVEGRTMEGGIPAEENASGQSIMYQISSQPPIRAIQLSGTLSR